MQTYPSGGGRYCQWSVWSSFCRDSCGGPDSRSRTCDCRTVTGWDQLDCTESASQVQDCPNSSSACFYSSPIFIVTMFGLSALVAGALIMLWLRFRAARLARAAATSRAATSARCEHRIPPYAFAISSPGLQLQQQQQQQQQQYANAGFQCEYPPAYSECLDGCSVGGSTATPASSMVAASSSVELPPAYEEAVAQMKRLHLTQQQMLESPSSAAGVVDASPSEEATVAAPDETSQQASSVVE